MRIQCTNRTYDRCTGDFAIPLHDVCYFLYEYKKIYEIQEINKKCLTFNQTEVDLTTNRPINIFYYLKNALTIQWKNKKPPWSYFSKKHKILHEKLR